MAVAFDVKATTDSGPGIVSGGTSTISNMTAGATATALIVTVCIGANLSTDLTTCAGVTWNGTSMTLLGNKTTTDGLVNAYAFGLAGIVTGNKNIVVTWGTSGTPGNCNAYVDATSWKGTDTTTAKAFPSANIITNASASVAPGNWPNGSQIVTTANGDAVFAVVNDSSTTYGSFTGGSGPTIVRADGGLIGNYTSAFTLATSSTTTVQFASGGAGGTNAAGVFVRIQQPQSSGGSEGGTARLYNALLNRRFQPNVDYPHQDFRLSGVTGTYAVTGSNATLTQSHVSAQVTAPLFAPRLSPEDRFKPNLAFPVRYVLTAGTGTYSVGGIASNTTAAYTVSGQQGTYSVNGQNATLTYVSASVSEQVTAPLFSPGLGHRFEPNLAYPAQSAQLVLSGQTGTYTVTGIAATETSARTMSGAQGTYTVTGNNANLNRAGLLSGAQGTYTVNGQAANLTSSRTVSGTTGTYTVNGVAATLPVHLSLVASTGSYSVNGQNATLTLTSGSGPVAQYSKPFIATAGTMTEIQ